MGSPALRLSSAALALFSCFCAPAFAQGAGDRAPEISAPDWFHWVGDGPTMRSLEGRAVLLHFFVCEKPNEAAFLPLLKFHHEYADKGLVILAVTADKASTVEKLLENYPLPFPVAASARDMRADWGVSGKYAQILVDRNGEIFYRADAANGIWNGKLLKGIKGAKRLKERAFLRLVPAADFGKKQKKPLDLLAGGELAKALGVLERAISSESTSDADRADAEALRKAVEDHVTALLLQIKAEFGRRESQLAWIALETLADDLDGHAFGKLPAERLEEARRDPAVKLELDASADYDKCVAAFFTRGWEKNLARFQKLVEEFPETRSAEKMQNYWISKRW